MLIFSVSDKSSYFVLIKICSLILAWASRERTRLGERTEKEARSFGISSKKAGAGMLAFKKITKCACTFN